MKHPLITLLALCLTATPLAGLRAAPACCPTGDLFDSDAPRDKVAITDLQRANLGLALAPAEEIEMERTTFALGRIEAIPNQQATLSSRIAGRVKSLEVNPGQSVQAGMPVISIESRQAGNPPPTITLDAPIDGVISEIDVQPGDPVEPDRHLLDVTDLRQVMAVANVFEHDAGNLQPGMQARIRVPAHGDRVFEGRLAYLGTAVDRRNATLPVFFEIDNPDLLLRPGMRAEFSIVTESREAILAVPREAILGEHGNHFVFLADYEVPGLFLKTPVHVGARNDRYAEVLAGLFPGDEVVTTGNFALQFTGGDNAALKDVMDAAHGHAHGPNGEELDESEASEALEGERDPASAGGGSSWASTDALPIAGAGLAGLFLGLLLGKRGRRETPAAASA